MLYHDRIDVPEGIDVNKTSKSKEWNIFYYWYFLNKGSKFQPDVCNGCHNLSMMSMKLSDNTILNFKGSDCCCIISSITKREDVNLMQNIGLAKKNRKLQNNHRSKITHT